MSEQLLEDKLRDTFAIAIENYKVGRGSPVELIAVASSGSTEQRSRLLRLNKVPLMELLPEKREARQACDYPQAGEQAASTFPTLSPAVNRGSAIEKLGGCDVLVWLHSRRNCRGKCWSCGVLVPQRNES